MRSTVTASLVVLLIGGFAGVALGQPVNSTCEQALPIGLGETVFGSSTGGTPRIEGCTASFSPSAWYTFVGEVPAERLSLCGDTFWDTILVAFEETCGGALIACSDDDCARQSFFDLSVEVGQTYFVQVTGYLGQSGSFFLTRTPLVAPCPCEFGGAPDEVDIQDLLAFLALWLPGEAGADYDGSDGVNILDLLAFLECWLPASINGTCS